MLKTLTAFIIILFSSEAMAVICQVYLPPDCKEVTGSDMSFYGRVYAAYSLPSYILEIEVNCTIDLESEYVDDLKVGDIFYGHKKYKISTPHISRDNRLEDYTILFHKYNKEKDDITKLPYVVCNFE